MRNNIKDYESKTDEKYTINPVGVGSLQDTINPLGVVEIETFFCQLLRYHGGALLLTVNMIVHQLSCLVPEQVISHQPLNPQLFFSSHAPTSSCISKTGAQTAH